MNCPHCKLPLKIAVYPQKTTKKSGLFQLVTSSIRNDPFVRLRTTQDGTRYIDELKITDSEFKRMAYAMSRNDWLFSKLALVRWGEFTAYRAQEIADNLSDVGLRFVDRQNRSTLLHRLMSHLRNALSAPD